MQQDRIVCAVHPFAMEQKINIFKDGENHMLSASLSNLGKEVMKLCYANNIYDVVVKVISCPTDFAETIQEEILEEEINAYSTNKINIEVM